MYAHQNFLEKAFCLVMNGKKMIGDDMEKGLAQLKAGARAEEPGLTSALFRALCGMRRASAARVIAAASNILLHGKT